MVLFFMVGMAATWGVGGLDGLLDLRPLFPETMSCTTLNEQDGAETF